MTKTTIPSQRSVVPVATSVSVSSPSRHGFGPAPGQPAVDVSVAMAFERQDMVCGIGPDRIIQGWGQANLNLIYLVVKGWWF